MILTKAEAQHLKQTLLSPGWPLVAKMAQERINEALLAALNNTERDKVLEMWDRAQAADKILRIFMLEVEDPKAGIGQE